MMEKTLYRQGRNNLSATIFVPYDCQNNCPFCTSKQDYRDCSNFSLNEIINKIKLLNRSKVIQEFVITGGEPFADIDKLKRIINACEKTVYINTTLPNDTLEAAINLINEERKIGGINVSRHIGFEFKNVASIEQLDRIKKPIRINTVITQQFTYESFIEFCFKYGRKYRDINLRADYRKITIETLKNRNVISDFLATKFDYIANESCMVCNSEYYSVNDEFIVAYHRGMMFSSVNISNKCYVNDVLIKQDGKIYKDWNFVEDKDFEQWILRN